MECTFGTNCVPIILYSLRVNNFVHYAMILILIPAEVLVIYGSLKPQSLAYANFMAHYFLQIDRYHIKCDFELDGL